MYLTIVGKAGRSNVIFTSRTFCKGLIASLQVMLDEYFFMITASIGSTITLLNGMIIHKGACLNYKIIVD